MSASEANSIIAFNAVAALRLNDSNQQKLIVRLTNRDGPHLTLDQGCATAQHAPPFRGGARQSVQPLIKQRQPICNGSEAKGDPVLQRVQQLLRPRAVVNAVEAGAGCGVPARRALTREQRQGRDARWWSTHR